MPTLRLDGHRDGDVIRPRGSFYVAPDAHRSLVDEHTVFVGLPSKMLSDEYKLGVSENIGKAILDREMDVHGSVTYVLAEVYTTQGGRRDAYVVALPQDVNAFFEAHGLHVAQLSRLNEPPSTCLRKLPPSSSYPRVSVGHSELVLAVAPDNVGNGRRTDVKRSSQVLDRPPEAVDVALTAKVQADDAPSDEKVQLLAVSV